MDAFVINLSNIFDFDISMPILSGLVAEKRIWVSKESGTFPVNPNETLVCNKLFEFSNYYEHMRVTLDVAKPTKKAELFLILGYEEWDFLPYGKFSAYPYFKILYILNKISEFFNKPQHLLPFNVRIFITQQAGSERHSFFDKIESSGYVESETPLWFSEEQLEQDLYIDKQELKQLLVRKNATDTIDEEIKQLLNQYYQQFVERIDNYTLQMQIQSTVSEKWKHDFRCILESFTTILQLSAFVESPMVLLKKYLFNTFSILGKINELPPIYKYVIDTSSTANGLRSKFEFALFIFQFVVEPMIEEKNKLYRINNIEVNVSALKLMLDKLAGTIQRYKKNPVDLEKQENYNVYSVNDSYYRNLPQLDNNDKNKFSNIRFLKRILGWFYHRDKKERMQQAYDKNPYSLLEHKLPVETGSFSSLLKDALNKQTKTITVRMIPSEIMRFEQSRLASPINLQHYTIKRDELLIKQNAIFNEVLKNLSTLPFYSNFLFASLKALCFFVLFSLPVFSMLYWDNLLVFFPTFIVLIAIAAFYTLYKVRRGLYGKLLELEQIRINLAGNLSIHCDNIKAAAQQMAEAFAKRETLKELKEIQKRYDEQSYRVLAFDKFHAVNDESIKLLCKIYGLNSTPTDITVINAMFDKHPEDDFNLINEFPVNDIDFIINQQITPKASVRTLLNKIEIVSI